MPELSNKQKLQEITDINNETFKRALRVSALSATSSAAFWSLCIYGAFNGMPSVFVAFYAALGAFLLVLAVVSLMIIWALLREES